MGCRERGGSLRQAVEEVLVALEQEPGALGEVLVCTDALDLVVELLLDRRSGLGTRPGTSPLDLIPRSMAPHLPSSLP